MYCNRCGTKVDVNATFCNKCGNYLNNNVNQSQKKIKSNFLNKNIKKIGVGIGSGLVIIVIFLLVNIFLGNFNSNYYFSEESNNNEEIKPIENNNTTSKSKSKTIIVTDNVYNGVSINSIDDAYNLISKDSTDQKNMCPHEILEVENNIIKKYQIKAVNLCEMDVQFAKELEKVFDVIYTEYPMARGYITNLTLNNTSMLKSGGVIAAFMPAFNFATSNTSTTYPWVIKTQILLSSPYFLNRSKLESSVKNSSSAGHFPKNANIYSPVAHELGHYLSFLAMMSHYNIGSILMLDANNINVFYELYSDFGKGNYSLNILNEAYNNYLSEGNLNLEFDEWRGSISAYALAKDNSGNYIYDETIAEAFHDVYLNSNNASIASQYIVRVLKERLGG